MMPPDARLDADIVAILGRVSGSAVEPTMTSDLVRDLGFDSMRRLELVAELEDHFDVNIPLNETPAIRTVGDVRDYVRELLRRQRPHA